MISLNMFNAFLSDACIVYILQEEAAIPTVEPLLIVYQDFVKPENVHQSEDFGYSTIADVVENMQPSQTT